MTGTTIETEEFKMTEIGALPFEWEVAKLGNLVKSTKGKKPHNMAKVTPSNSLPYLTAVYFRTGQATHFVSLDVNVSLVLVENNDVVFIWDGSNAGDVFTGLKGVLASTMVKIVPEDSNTLDKKYLFYFLKNRFDLFNSTTTGSTIPHVNKKVFQDLSVPVPPLPEQKKIAYVLSTVQTAIEKTEAVINAARELKKSLMKHLFTYGPVTIDEVENVPLKETEIGMVPEHWQQTELGQIADIVYGVQAAVANLTDSSIGIPILTNINVRNDGMLDISTLRYYPLPENKRDKLILKKGDVLFNWRSGSPLHVGKTAIFNLDGDYTFSSFILRFRSCADSTSNEYLFRYLNLLKSSGFFLSKRSQSSVNSVFNASLAAKIPILLPPTLDQIKISSMLSSADRKIEAEEDRKKALEALFKTLLTRLMTGKIRVNNLEAPV